MPAGRRRPRAASGTLFAFVLVAIGVIVLRRTRPELDRPFRVPGVPFVPILSVLASGWLMLNLQTSTWIRSGVWMLIGFVVYFGYSVRHSRVGREGGEPREDDAPRRPERVPAGTTGA